MPPSPSYRRLATPAT